MFKEKMTSTERRAVGSLASIMSLRLIGLFMVLPVFALYAHTLNYATPFLIGLAVGIYGLTQGLLQIPFGMLSDHIGRKPVIAGGLVLFALGSLLAAFSHSIYAMLAGRALQGAGAIGSTVIAALADLTREDQRTKAMAINGITIGTSFSVAMMLGPLLAAGISVSGIFGLAAVFSVIGVIILFVGVPVIPHSEWHGDVEAEKSQFFAMLIQPQLARLNLGAFLLHAIFTASFIVIPISLQNNAGMASSKQWIVYVPTLLLAFFCSILMIAIAEKKHLVKPFFIAGICLILASEAVLMLGAYHLISSALGLLLFFTGFSLLEAFLPSYVSRSAPKSRKGTVTGIYSCAQFLGIFAGGALGGWLYGSTGLLQVYLLCIGLAILWLAIAFGMKNPQHSTTQQAPSSQTLAPDGQLFTDGRIT
jgi:MFS family permease